MNKIARFEKVSYEQFRDDWNKAFPYYSEHGMDIEDDIREIYDNIMLPKRSTIGSAGYDFYLPDNIKLFKNYCATIPTGIRCDIDDGWVLAAFPRSGHGFKYGVHLANTVGIIDADYYDAKNEGHIHIKLVNDSMLSSDIILERGTAFCQGIFLPFGITFDDEADAKRIGGFGSTDSK